MTVAAASGENVPMHKVIQSVSEAELTLQTMLTVRDKAVEAYQEILRMPI
jgi:flagellar hook-basal body complex protein FliE